MRNVRVGKYRWYVLLIIRHFINEIQLAHRQFGTWKHEDDEHFYFPYLEFLRSMSQNNKIVIYI